MSGLSTGKVFWSPCLRAGVALWQHATRCGSCCDLPIGLRWQKQSVWQSSKSARNAFSTSVCRSVKQMPQRPKIDEEDITEAFLKGTGPGGQKINKTNSAVQLKHIPTGIVVKVQETRSRSQNRKIARQLLAERVEELEKGSESRVAVIAEVKRKKKSSAAKKSRRKYRALDAARADSLEDIDSSREVTQGTAAVDIGLEQSSSLDHSSPKENGQLTGLKEPSLASPETDDHDPPTSPKS